MKPTPQISLKQRGSPRDLRNFPVTDYNFRATADAKSGSSTVRPATKAPAFHKLSSEVFGGETNRDYLAELLVLILMTGIAAWPVISAIVAVTRMVRNY
jgi:hypothetical protein